MPRIALDHLGCSTPFTGTEDDLLLEVRIDGDDQREPYVHRQQMTAGDQWAIDHTYAFATEAELTLRRWSDQSPNRAGRVTVTSGSTTPATFTDNGAQYELTYTVNQGSYDGVQTAIDEFDQSSASSVWVGLGPKSGLIARLRSLTNHSPTVRGVPVNPFALDQDGTNTCGPAGVGFTLAFRFPQRLATLAQSLYERGAFLGDQKVYETTDALRRNPFPSRVVQRSVEPDQGWEAVWDQLSMNPFDWMVISGVGGIQDAFGYDRPGQIPDALAWLSDVLGYGTTGHAAPETYDIIVANPSLPWTRESQAETMFHEAHKAVRAGGIAYLLIESTAFWRQWDSERDEQRLVRAEFFGPTYSHLVTLAQSSWGGQGGTHDMLVHDNGQARHRQVTADELEEWLAAVVTGQ